MGEQGNFQKSYANVIHSGDFKNVVRKNKKRRLFTGANKWKSPGVEEAGEPDVCIIQGVPACTITGQPRDIVSRV
jgi:hypothetical protein